MRKILVLFSCLMFLALPSVSAASNQQTLGELRSEYQNKLKEKEENESKTEAAKEEIKAKEEAIAQAEADIHAAIAEQEKVEEEIEISNQKIKELTEKSEQMFRYLQEMKGSNAYVEYVSGASTITDFIMRVNAVELITDKIQKTMEELEEEIQNNERLKQELIDKQNRLKAQEENYRKVIEARYQDIESYDKYALDINTQIKSLKDKLDAAEKNCKAYAPDKGDNAVISKDCVKPVASGTVVNNGAWLKPLTSGKITSEIGYRWGSYHNALDIGGNPEGTPVYAAAAGVVSGKIARYRCGGNMLYIDVTVNGQPYTTYYYHLLRFNVNIGDFVDQNTIIGFVGGGAQTASIYGGYDTCTTGQHLHFGVARGFYNGYSVPSSNVITPPGFPNTYGWRFSSRYQMFPG